VHLLPYLDQKALHAKFHLDESWDSDHNKKLIAEIPPVFACPARDLGEGKTTYRVPNGEHGFLNGSERVRLRDITDGTSNTIMIVDASHENAVIWTKPGSFEIDPKEPRAGLDGDHEKLFYAAFGDGSVHRLPLGIASKTLTWLFDSDDGNPIPRF